MLHYETIHPDTLELLRKIQSLEMFKDARLVGGVVFHRQFRHLVFAIFPQNGNSDHSFLLFRLQIQPNSKFGTLYLLFLQKMAISA